MADRVWLEVTAGEDAGKIVIQLFPGESPRTCENFRRLCTGERGTMLCGESGECALSYAGTPFHKVQQGFIAQGGDITRGGHTNAYSTYGRQFADENLRRSHNKAGCVSMANNGSNTNGAQFFITLSGEHASYLDGRHCCFGEVVEGLEWFLGAAAKSPKSLAVRAGGQC